MNRFLVVGLLALLTLIAVPAFAQSSNNCVAFQCSTPPPYDCSYCSSSIYSGPSSCTVGTFGSNEFCFMSGSCDTGMTDCEPSAGTRCVEYQTWTKMIHP